MKVLIAIMTSLCLLISACSSSTGVNRGVDNSTQKPVIVRTINNNPKDKSERLSAAKIDYFHMDKKTFAMLTQRSKELPDMPVTLILNPNSDKDCLLKNIRLAMIESDKELVKNYLKSHETSINDDIALLESLASEMTLDEAILEYLGKDIKNTQTQQVMRNLNSEIKLFTNHDLKNYVFNEDSFMILDMSLEFVNTVQKECRVDVHPELLEELKQQEV